MRFAAVTYHCRTVDRIGDVGESRRHVREGRDEVVWFATTSDPVFVDDALDATERKELLLEAFGSWHDPVSPLIESTPAEEIMYELAITHQYCANPVFDVARIMEFESWQERRTKSRDMDGGRSIVDGPRYNGGKINGDGPILVFIGDAMRVF